MVSPTAPSPFSGTEGASQKSDKEKASLVKRAASPKLQSPAAAQTTVRVADTASPLKTSVAATGPTKLATGRISPQRSARPLPTPIVKTSANIAQELRASLNKQVVSSSLFHCVATLATDSQNYAANDFTLRRQLQKDGSCTYILNCCLVPPLSKKNASEPQKRQDVQEKFTVQEDGKIHLASGGKAYASLDELRKAFGLGQALTEAQINASVQLQQEKSKVNLAAMGINYLSDAKKLQSLVVKQNSEVCKDVLAASEKGTYLVRPSSKDKDWYTLEYAKGDGSTDFIRVKVDQNTMWLQNAAGAKQSFENLQGIEEYLKKRIDTATLTPLNDRTIGQKQLQLNEKALAKHAINPALITGKKVGQIEKALEDKKFEVGTYIIYLPVKNETYRELQYKQKDGTSAFLPLRVQDDGKIHLLKDSLVDGETHKDFKMAAVPNSYDNIEQLRKTFDLKRQLSERELK